MRMSQTPTPEEDRLIRELISELRQSAETMAHMIDFPPAKRLDQYKAHIGDLTIYIRRIARSLST